MGPTLVFLHEGLGSISQWRDFPDGIAAATGLPAMVYARYGHGQSTVLQQPHGVDFMHREALESLPDLLRALGIARPILIGHSDGASIALIYAGSGHPVQGLVAMSPHVFVEDISIAGIVAAKQAFETTDLPQSSRAITAMRARLSTHGTTSGWRRHFAVGTSSASCPRFTARCWRSRGRRTNTAAWRRSMRLRTRRVGR